jgi:hypothetical protein
MSFSFRLGGELPFIRALVWKNQIVHIYAFEKGLGDIRDGYEFWWRLERIVIPKALEPEAEAVLALIQEAFIAMGNCFELTKKTNAVHFDFIASPLFV